MDSVKTPVSILHKFLLDNNRENAIFEMVSSGSDSIGTQNQTIWIRLDLGGLISFGKGSSKEEAKNEAALDALTKLAATGYYIPDSLETSRSEGEKCARYPYINPNFQIEILEKFIADHNLPPAEFTVISNVGPSHRPVVTMQCVVGTLKKTATNFSIKKTKEVCAQLMYQCLIESSLDVVETDEICDILEELPNISTS